MNMVIGISSLAISLCIFLGAVTVKDDITSGTLAIASGVFMISAAICFK